MSGDAIRDSEVAALIERLARLMRAAEFEHGLNPAQWEALRYLGRCNRFSNSPGALALYLGATKGTVSQTVQALERKGLVEKASRGGPRRSVTLSLTDAGRDMLRCDPRRRIGPKAAAMSDREWAALRGGLRILLLDRLARNRQKTFGVCGTCRFLERDGAIGDPAAPHRCGLLKVPLGGGDASRICVEHEPALDQPAIR